MSEINKDQVVEWLSSQTVLEISDLVKELEEKWGVSAAAPVAAVAAAPVAGGGAEPAEEKTEFDIELVAFPSDKKIAIIKEVRAITGLGLKEAKEMAESVPAIVKEAAAKADAEEIQKKLEDAGAEVKLK